MRSEAEYRAKGREGMVYAKRSSVPMVMRPWVAAAAAAEGAELRAQGAELRAKGDGLRNI